MMECIALDLQKADWIGKATYAREGADVLASFPPRGGAIVWTGENLSIGGVDWRGVNYLVLEVTGLLPRHDLSIWVEFREFADYRVGNTGGFHIGALPECRTQLVMDLRALDSQQMHLPRTPGRLKAGVTGRGMDIASARYLSISLHDGYCAQQVRIHGVYLHRDMPEIDFHPGTLVDDLGQYNRCNWKSKTKSIEQMAERLRAELKSEAPECMPERSRYGGDLSTRWEATGYFRTHFDGKRWYLADPEGYRFVSVGLDCVIPSESSYLTGIEHVFEGLPDRERYPEFYRESHDPRDAQASALLLDQASYNLFRVFGADWKRQWMELTRRRLLRWGYNTIGNWSDLEFIRFAHMPYVWPLSDFPTTQARIFRDFPDVFSQEYEKNAETFAQQLEAFAGDANMIGYFLRNEPEWAFVGGLLIAEKVLETPCRTDSKMEFIQRLTTKYGDIERLNRAWNTDYSDFCELEQPLTNLAARSPEAYGDAEAFSRELIRRYVGVPAAACRAVDANHLNLGMRYAYITYPMLTEGAECFDVFSINCYQDDPYRATLEAGELTNKPVLVGEFHFGAMDAGLFSTGQNGVMTQRDRGLAYRVYYERGLNCPYFLGAHNFILNDQAVLGRSDGENMQIGCVDVCQSIYDDYVEETTWVNQEIYALADGRRTMPCPHIQRIPRVGF